jgi:hypothetical protein
LAAPGAAGKRRRSRAGTRRGREDQGSDERVERPAERTAERDPEVELGQPGGRRPVGGEPAVAEQAGDDEAAEVQDEQDGQWAPRLDHERVRHEDGRPRQQPAPDCSQAAGIGPLRERDHEREQVQGQGHPQSSGTGLTSRVR